jgi:hypothetical protein
MTPPGAPPPDTPNPPSDRTPPLARHRPAADSPAGVTAITPHLLATLPDKRLAQAIFDHIRDRVGEDYAATEGVLAALPPGFSLVYQLFALDGEIGQGGFNHYFYSGLDQYVAAQTEALGLIQAEDHLRILAQAQAIHTAEQSNATLQRLYAEGTPAALAATYRLTALGQCDDAWYALEKQLDAQLAAFIRSHPELFLTGA